MKLSFHLVVHDNLGQLLMTISHRDEILKAYATQKYLMSDNNIFLNEMNSSVKGRIAQCISNVSLSTNQNLINKVIISFEATMVSNDSIPVILDHLNERKVEKEIRRSVESNHPLLVKKLGCSCNDLSNMSFISREVEINFGNYRMYINNERYTVQFKKHHKTEIIVLTPEYLSLEALHYSFESPIYESPLLICIDDKNTFIGIASFLDCKNVSIKTVYFDDGRGSVLYQRILLDDYSKLQPFILEKEFISDHNDFTLYNWASWRLNAELPTKFIPGNGIFSLESKPKIINTDTSQTSLQFPKLDGIPATLRFYDDYFVVTNSILYSDSYIHKLPKHIAHVLKDYYFLVESNLYTSDIKIKAERKPNPMAIIDLHLTHFNPKQRMDVIQNMKRIFGPYLYEYFIFFQGEPVLQSSPVPSLPIHLKHGVIYETTLSNENIIHSVVRERKDKLYPNSSKVVKMSISKITS